MWLIKMFERRATAAALSIIYLEGSRQPVLITFLLRSSPGLFIDLLQDLWKCLGAGQAQTDAQRRAEIHLCALLEGIQAARSLVSK